MYYDWPVLTTAEIRAIAEDPCLAPLQDNFRLFGARTSPSEDIATRAEKRRAYRLEHGDEMRSYERAYKAAHRKTPVRTLKTAEEKRRTQANAQLVSKYGITLAQKTELLAAQGGVCKICQQNNPGPKRGWHTDHKHGTKIVRGILCAGCNTTLGRCKDDPALLKRMVLYLEGNL